MTVKALNISAYLAEPGPRGEGAKRPPRGGAGRALPGALRRADIRWGLV